jgi:hypothetical protein
LNGRFARLITIIASCRPHLQRMPAGTAAAAMLAGMLVMAVGFHFGNSPSGFVWGIPGL